jgi:hypothetical protein
MDISEYKKLMKAASEGKTTASENGSDGEQHERPISSLVKNALGVADKSKFKRNRAFLVSFVGWLTISSVYYLSRHQQWLSSLLLIYFLYQMLTSILFQGPNPLSCKKKKPKPQPSAIQNQVCFCCVALCLPPCLSSLVLHRKHVHHKHLYHIVKSSLVQGQQLNTYKLSWFQLFQDTVTT